MIFSNGVLPARVARGAFDPLAVAIDVNPPPTLRVNAQEAAHSRARARAHALPRGSRVKIPPAFFPSASQSRARVRRPPENPSELQVPSPQLVINLRRELPLLTQTRS